MLKKIIFALALMTIFATVPTFAGNCKNDKFFGSYTNTTANIDVFGDGSVVHTFVNQLTLNSDGTANLYWTGFNDYMINLGTGSHSIGSWDCRNDGKLVVTLITGVYAPSVPDGNAPSPDITLVQHYRTTYLFAIDNKNTIRRIQSRTRRYTPAQDPGDPTGGTLGALNNTELTYKRLIANDDDLLAP